MAGFRQQRLQTHVSRFLEDGEQARHIVKVMEGPNRWLGIVAAVVGGSAIAVLTNQGLTGVATMGIIYMGLYQRRLLVFTDRGLVYLGCFPYVFVPTKVMARWAKGTHVAKPSGLWQRSEVEGRRIWVVPRSLVALAEATIDQGSSRPSGSSRLSGSSRPGRRGTTPPPEPTVPRVVPPSAKKRKKHGRVTPPKR